MAGRDGCYARMLTPNLHVVLHPATVAEAATLIADQALSGGMFATRAAAT